MTNSIKREIWLSKYEAYLAVHTIHEQTLATTFSVAIKILLQWISIITGNTLGKQIAPIFVCRHFWSLWISTWWILAIKPPVQDKRTVEPFSPVFPSVLSVTSRGGSCNYSFGAGMCKLSCCFKKIETMWDFRWVKTDALAPKNLARLLGTFQSNLENTLWKIRKKFAIPITTLLLSCERNPD